MPYRKSRIAVWWGLLCVYSLFLPSACRTESKIIETTTLRLESNITDSWKVFKINNNKDKDVLCNVDVNRRLFKSKGDLLELIRITPDLYLNEPEVSKAWRFVKSNLQYNIPVSEAAWMHQPTIIFNSLGFGQCDDLASALAFIWREMGYETRIWNLNGHVVPEVFADGKWQMFDPSYDVYYYNEHREVAGFEELCANPSLVTGKFGRLKIDNFRNLAELNFKVLRYSEELQALYAKGGKPVTEWHIPNVDDNMSFLVPAGGNIIFPVNSPSPVIISNWKGMKRQLVHYMRITIPKGWKGKFYCLLVITSVSGSGVLVIDNKPIPLQNFSLQFDLNAENPIHEFYVKEALFDIDVYALINPWLFNIPGKNNVIIEGADVEHLTLNTEKSEAPYPTLINYVMDHRYLALPAHFIRYEEQKDTLDEMMFNRRRPLKTKEDICINAKTYFNMWHAGSKKAKQDRANSICKKMLDFYSVLPDDQIKKDVLGFMSDPLAFIMLIYILEEYPEYTLNELL